jgi:integrase
MPSSVSERRSYGTGGLFTRTDSGGRESWYGKFRKDGRQVKRKIGAVRKPGASEGFTRTQAERELARLIQETTIELRPDVSHTLADVAPLYVDDLRRKGRKKSTITAVESALRVWLLPFFDGRTLDSVKAQDVNDLIALMESGTRLVPTHKRHAVGAKSIHNYIGTLSSIFGWAMAPRRAWATHNPAADVDLPAIEENDDIRFLEPHEVRALSDAALAGDYQSIDSTMYLTAAMTGLRQGELLALRWRDVDWTAGRIRVRQNFVLGSDGPRGRRSARPSAQGVGMAGRRRPRVRRSAGRRRADAARGAHAPLPPGAESRAARRHDALP